jgi:PAS domain S-box-containing protein
VAHDRALGLVVVLSEQVGFLEEEAELVEFLAARIALAVEGSQLYADVSRQAAENQAILEAAPDAFLIADFEGRITVVNRQAEQLLGYSRHELIGAEVETLVPEPLRDAHLAHRAGYVHHPRTRPMGAGFDLRARRKDGSQVPVEISLSALHRSDGDLVIAAIRDVSDRRAQEELLRQNATELAESNRQLAETNAQLQEFAYVASHDLQEPLRMVVSFLELLDRRYRDKLDDDGREFIRFAVDGGTRMQTMIRDLLTYSRAGSEPLRRERFDSRELVGDVVLSLTPLIEDTDGMVEFDHLPIIYGDPVQLSRVFQNLIGNGLKFRGAEPPRVSIEAEPSPDGWVFTVRDNGIGMEPEQTERIFGLFQRLHSQAEYSGSGIGLSVTRRIVERHGGTIRVETAPGKGSAFSFTLPPAEDS